MLSKNLQKSTLCFLTLFFIFEISGAVAQTTNDALCLNGSRNIDLSNQMPPTKDQGKRGVCYIFAASAALEAARVRNTGKAPRPISESFLLGALFLDQNNTEIDTRVKNIKAYDKDPSSGTPTTSAQPTQFKTSYSDAGYFQKVIESGIKYRRIPAVESASKDFERLVKIDQELSMEALEKGENFNMPDLRPYGRELVRGARKNAHEADLDSDFNFRTLQIKNISNWNAKNGLRETLYTDLRTWKKSLGVIEDVARWYKEKTGEDLDYSAIGKMSASQFDSFVNQASRKLAIAQAKEARQNPSLRIVDPNYERFAPVLTDLYYAPQSARDTKDKIRGSFASRLFYRKAPEFDPLSRDEFERELKDFHKDCNDASAETRKNIISSLCSGIPVSVAIADILGTQMETKVGSDTIWKDAPQVAAHAVVITGIEQVNGEPYYIMRNSSYFVERLRMPVSLSCRIYSSAVVLGPKDPGYVATKNNFLEEMQNARERHR